MKNPPFFYKVSFHFLAQEPDNELKHESWQKETSQRKIRRIFQVGKNQAIIFTRRWVLVHFSFVITI